MDVVFFHIASIFRIRITSCRSGIYATSNFKTHCLGPQEGRLLTDNSRRLPGSARAVSRTRDRNCSSTTDNCRRGAAAATDALRAYCCTAEHRYYPPSHEKAETDTAHGVRARDRRGNTARSCGRRGKPESTISRRLSQGYTKIYFPRDFQLGRSSKPRLLRSSSLLKAQPGPNVSLDAAACVYGDHFCAKPKREPVSTQWCSEEDQVEQTFKRFISITPLSF